MTALRASALRHLSRAALISAVAIAAFCDAQAQMLPPPVVTVVAGIKQIELSWPVVPGASYYVVRESPSAGAPFTAISPQIPQGKSGATLRYTKPIAVHRHDWLDAQTRYIKARNPGADDPFGGAFARGALALSGDATTLVVPAADEDGENDATPNAGAVYLY